MDKKEKEFLVRKAIRLLLESHNYSVEESVRILKELAETGQRAIDEGGDY